MPQNLFERYDEAADLLSAQDVMATPAELHGVLCGLLCGGAPYQGNGWLQAFNELVNDGQPLPASVSSWLREVGDASWQGLEGDAGLTLLLPTEETSLEERLLAVADWAQAFLAGFAVMQRKLDTLSDDLQEILADMGEITRLEQTLEEEEGGGSEADFMVIYEHLKLGAIMAFEECGATEDGSPAPATLH